MAKKKTSSSKAAGKRQNGPTHTDWEEIPEVKRSSGSGDFWRPEPGDQIECVLFDKKEGRYGDYFVAQTSDGEEIRINVTAGIRDLPLERWLRLKYLGKEEGDKQRHLWKVFKGPAYEASPIPFN